jgi:hypothetical protein
MKLFKFTGSSAADHMCTSSAGRSGNENSAFVYGNRALSCRVDEDPTVEQPDNRSDSVLIRSDSVLIA